MCTVSVIPPSLTRALRVVVNRDERWTRSVAWAPHVISRADVQVIAPVDSESLGTWVAATGAGLVYALLNLNRDSGLMPRVPRTSRGHVIPALATADDYDEANRRFRALDVEQFGPFRLIITEGLSATICQWDGSRIELQSSALERPFIASSSSLGDELVEAPRSALFGQLLATEADPWRAQDRLHQHSWPDRRHLSVMMSRATARTVSRTVVVMDADAARMSYAPVIDGWIGPVTGAHLTRLRMPLAVAG